MAKTNRICSVEKCDKIARTRGWCRDHYRRWQKHGDPLSGRTPRGERERYFREVVMTYEGDECMQWPFSKNSRGYATTHRNGQPHLCSRLVCEEANGPPPTPEHEAAHSCGNGHLACVTKRHISWKTRAENQADKLTHGTHNRGERHNMAKLTENDVLAIRALQARHTQDDIAKRFSISRRNVSDIINRKTWDWLE